MNPMTIDRRWIAITVGLLLLNVLVMGVLVVAATRRPAAVIPRYYERAVAWDQSQAEAQLASELGWRIDVELTSGGASVRARDGAGGPLAGAHVKVAGFHRGVPAQRADVELVTDAQGVALGTPLAWRGAAGIYELDIAVKRGAIAYSVHREVELADAARAAP